MKLPGLLVHVIMNNVKEPLGSVQHVHCYCNLMDIYAVTAAVDLCKESLESLKKPPGSRFWFSKDYK